ncbi:hypothetical protein AHAS_Ahas17G0137600 [Arachis hypogaea]
MELAAARQEGFVSKQLLKTNGTYSEGRPLVMIGILTTFGRQKNRDAIRNAWMGSDNYGQFLATMYWGVCEIWVWD